MCLHIALGYRHLRFIEQLMRNLAALGLMRSLMRRDEIADQIIEAHQRLSDCLAIFHVRLVMACVPSPRSEPN